jgi:DNA polymerase elongation subunit (family B)
MDAYRKENSIILWIKTNEEELRVEREFATSVYVDTAAEDILKKHGIPFSAVKKKTYMRNYKKVLEVPVPNLSQFERFISYLEKITRYRIPFFNADIKPEQMFLYRYNLKPFCSIEIDDEIIALPEGHPIPLKKLRLNVTSLGDIHKDSAIEKIVANEKEFFGDEETLLNEFAEEFKKIDPDVIVMDYAFSRLPYLFGRFFKYKINCPLHRWDAMPIIYRGGRSYWSYGQVRYQDYAVRLHGRFLVDTNSFMGTECEPEAIAELCQLSGTLFQQAASRSFGAIFQTALVREMVRQDILVPFKEKPIDKPLSMLAMLKADRAGFTFDPKIGFHSDVAELDFVSMFPWLIYNHNISADTVLAEKGPYAHIPNVPIKISMRYKGLIPIALKPFIDRRMYYKMHPSAVNKERAHGLKWVLVSCYGYLRFREFKLGIPTSHMAIGALARETILKIIHLAEEKGFTVVHAIVDSVYIKKKGMTDDEVKDFCKEVEMLTGIPLSFEGIYKWIVFLPSVVDKERALPSSYYGVFRSGDIKARGIEVRQRSVPHLVKVFQQYILELMKECSTKKEITAKAPLFYGHLRSLVSRLASLEKDYLIVNVRVSKTDYKHKIPQKIIVEKLHKQGITVMPGQFIRFIFQQDKVVLPEEYNGKPDVFQYKKLLIRSLFVLLQPFGFTREDVCLERQTKIPEFVRRIRHVYIPVSKEYPSKHGLSEKLIKKKMENEGWTVWRGELIGILRYAGELFPNVVKKYERLVSLLEKYYPGLIDELCYINSVHHGMPDFICFRNSLFKFVECKLQYETLSAVQKKCIYKLLDMGFDVEVHKIVDHRTKLRTAEVDIIEGEKRVLEKQAVLVHKFS